MYDKFEPVQSRMNCCPCDLLRMLCIFRVWQQ